MELCELCHSKFTFVNRKFTFDDGHTICTKCQNFLGFWHKPSEDKFKAIPFSQVQMSYAEKQQLDEDGKKEQNAEDASLSDVKNMVSCPQCKSTDLNFMGNKRKSFSVGKAAGGAFLTGGIGTLAGFAGKKGDNQWHCKRCGSTFTTRK